MSSQKFKKKKSKSKKAIVNPDLPPAIEETRTRVSVGATHVTHTRGVHDAGAYASLGYDNSFNLENFKQGLNIEITSLTEDEMTFELKGVDAPIANAFRRILIAEVPTMAIHKVVLFQNTSIIQDEVLAHRLGLIPLKVDPRKFKFMKESKDVPNEENTIVFTLDVQCTVIPDVPETATPEERFKHASVFSSDLKWVPQGTQAERFEDEPIAPTYDDILLAKLRPGQEIVAELHCYKGTGAEHAKWSPVATAAYRLLPEIKIVEDVKDEKAQELVDLCPMGVFDIEDMGSYKQAVASNPRNCTMCRECVRTEEWEPKIKLSRVRDHFLFSVESTGGYSPPQLFKEAVHLFIKKCKVILEELQAGRVYVEDETPVVLPPRGGRKGKHA